MDDGKHDALKLASNNLANQSISFSFTCQPFASFESVQSPEPRGDERTPVLREPAGMQLTWDTAGLEAKTHPDIMQPGSRIERLGVQCHSLRGSKGQRWLKQVSSLYLSVRHRSSIGALQEKKSLLGAGKTSGANIWHEEYGNASKSKRCQSYNKWGLTRPTPLWKTFHTPKASKSKNYDRCGSMSMWIWRPNLEVSRLEGARRTWRAIQWSHLSWYNYLTHAAAKWYQHDIKYVKISIWYVYNMHLHIDAVYNVYIYIYISLSLSLSLIKL